MFLQRVCVILFYFFPPAKMKRTRATAKVVQQMEKICRRHRLNCFLGEDTTTKHIQGKWYCTCIQVESVQKILYVIVVLLFFLIVKTP